jgi:hypothetical protein
MPDLNGLSEDAQMTLIKQSLRVVKNSQSLSNHQLNSPVKQPAASNSNHHGSILNRVALSNYHQTGHSSGAGMRLDLDQNLSRHRNHLNHSPDSDSVSSTRSPAETAVTSNSLHGLGHGLSQQNSSFQNLVPTLTPSLANYFREHLVGHVTGWVAEQAERQAQKYSEEAHNLGSLNCTRVSAELKMARSLVRLTEIQATLQEQRILFVRHSIKEVEEWKSTQTTNN